MTFFQDVAKSSPIVIVDPKSKPAVAKASILKHKPSAGGLSPGNGNPDEYSNSSRQHLAAGPEQNGLRNYVRVDKVSQDNPDTEDGVVHGCITLAGNKDKLQDAPSSFR